MNDKSIEQKIRETILSDIFCIRVKNNIRNLEIAGLKLQLINDEITIFIEEPFKSAIEKWELILSERIEQIKSQFTNQK